MTTFSECGMEATERNVDSRWLIMKWINCVKGLSSSIAVDNFVGRVAYLGYYFSGNNSNCGRKINLHTILLENVAVPLCLAQNLTDHICLYFLLILSIIIFGDFNCDF